MTQLAFSGTGYSQAYTLSGQPITLGSGGITSTMPAALSMPIALTASTQTWTLTDSAVDLSGGLTGSTALSLDLASGMSGAGALGLTGDAEVGAVTVTGAGYVMLTPGSEPGSLNGTNGNPVSL
ncbi:MAG: hypothetical protein WAL61_06105, partial [Acidimicrobiales bacterium]